MCCHVVDKLLSLGHDKAAVQIGDLAVAVLIVDQESDFVETTAVGWMGLVTAPPRRARREPPLRRATAPTNQRPRQTSIDVATRLIRPVVEGLALVDDVNGQKLEGRIADDPVRAMGYVTRVHADCTGGNSLALAVWRFDSRSTEDILRLLTVVDVQR